MRSVNITPSRLICTSRSIVASVRCTLVARPVGVTFAQRKMFAIAGVKFSMRRSLSRISTGASGEFRAQIDEASNLHTNINEIVCLPSQLVRVVRYSGQEIPVGGIKRDQRRLLFVADENKGSGSRDILPLSKTVRRFHHR
jgi:hypothetical protein